MDLLQQTERPDFSSSIATEGMDLVAMLDEKLARSVCCSRRSAPTFHRASPPGPFLRLRCSMKSRGAPSAAAGPSAADGARQLFIEHRNRRNGPGGGATGGENAG